MVQFNETEPGFTFIFQSGTLLNIEGGTVYCIFNKCDFKFSITEGFIYFNPLCENLQNLSVLTRIFFIKAVNSQIINTIFSHITHHISLITHHISSSPNHQMNRSSICIFFPAGLAMGMATAWAFMCRAFTPGEFPG